MSAERREELRRVWRAVSRHRAAWGVRDPLGYVLWVARRDEFPDSLRRRLLFLSDEGSYEPPGRPAALPDAPAELAERFRPPG